MPNEGKEYNILLCVYCTSLVVEVNILILFNRTWLSVDLHTQAWHSEIFNKWQINIQCRIMGFKYYPYVFPFSGKGVVTNAPSKEDL